MDSRVGSWREQLWEVDTQLSSACAEPGEPEPIHGEAARRPVGQLFRSGVWGEARRLGVASRISVSTSMQTGGCRGEGGLETSPRHPACNKWAKSTHKSRVREPRDTQSRNKRDLSGDPVVSSAMCCARRSGGFRTGPSLRTGMPWGTFWGTVRAERGASEVQVTRHREHS